MNYKTSGLSLLIGLLLVVLAMNSEKFAPTREGTATIVVKQEPMITSENESNFTCKVTDDYSTTVFQYKGSNQGEVKKFCSQFAIGKEYSISYLKKHGVYSILHVNRELDTEVDILFDEEKLQIKQNIVTENEDEGMYEVTDEEKIRTFLSILKIADWIHAKAGMPVENFLINNKYAIWIASKKDRLEVFIRGEDKYTRLSKNDSEVLYEIIKGEKLSE